MLLSATRQVLWSSLVLRLARRDPAAIAEQLHVIRLGRGVDIGTAGALLLAPGVEQLVERGDIRLRRRDDNVGVHAIAAENACPTVARPVAVAVRRGLVPVAVGALARGSAAVLL